jgi:hypothetical protein
VPLDTALLREIRTQPTRLTVYYRQVWLPNDGSPPNPLLVRREGRWPTDWTLYTATGREVAWAEYCRNHPDDVADADPTGGVGLDEATLDALGETEIEVPARALFALEFAFDTLVDLTSSRANELLTRAGFDHASFFADPPGYGQCPELASLAGDLGWQAIMVPSAAWRWSDGLCVPIFRDGEPMLAGYHRITDAARPSIAIAAAATYHDGRRPGWLA